MHTARKKEIFLKHGWKNEWTVVQCLIQSISCRLGRARNASLETYFEYFFILEMINFSEMVCAREGVRGSLLCALDSCISILIVTPLVVGYWRGCWQLMGIFLFPTRPTLSVYSSVAIGIIPHFVFCLAQHKIKHLIDVNKSKILFLVVSRAYTAVFAIVSVNHWRGIWFLWDLYTGTSWQSGAISAALGLFLLVITRGVKNILAPPFVICHDDPNDYFTVHTLFNAQVSPIN